MVVAGGYDRAAFRIGPFTREIRWQTDDPAAMTPAAAVARHVEWLEFALAAARDEETRRRERLGRATDKNREKRTVRLAEVTAEVRELAALVQGLEEPPGSSATASRAGRHAAAEGGSRGSRHERRRPRRASAPAAAAAATPKATAAANRRSQTTSDAEAEADGRASRAATSGRQAEGDRGRQAEADAAAKPAATASGEAARRAAAAPGPSSPPS